RSRHPRQGVPARLGAENGRAGRPTDNKGIRIRRIAARIKRIVLTGGQDRGVGAKGPWSREPSSSHPYTVWLGTVRPIPSTLTASNFAQKMPRSDSRSRSAPVNLPARESWGRRGG